MIVALLRGSRHAPSARDGGAPRRWVRRAGLASLALVVLVGSVHLWAWASLDRSTVARAVWWRNAEVADQSENR